MHTSYARSFVSLAMVLYYCLGPLATAETGRPLPSTAWQRPVAVYSFALYFDAKRGDAPEKLARKLATDPQFGFHVVDKPDVGAKDKRTLTLSSIVGNVETAYKPPSMESLKYFGRGLSLAQAQALQKSPQVLVMVFAHPARDALPNLLRANEFALSLATQTQALIWDEETREIFTPDVWKQSRIATWEGPWPDASRHTVIHAYNNKGKVRSITLGMGKFALPDLVINDTTWSLNGPLGTTINLTAQKLVESDRPLDSGQLDFQIASLKHSAVRKKIASSVINKGQARGSVQLLQTTAQDGDPDNALLELRFPQFAGTDSTSRQTAFVTSVFGAHADDIIRVKHDTDVREASERARKQLPTLKAAFTAGLRPGETLSFKAPFATATGGTEWMWVEVTKWSGNQISGMLRNEPREVPSLKAGQIVDIKQDEVFDYIRRSPDGKQEGNETGEILSKVRK